jgi:hypothetical protein
LTIICTCWTRYPGRCSSTASALPMNIFLA